MSEYTDLENVTVLIAEDNADIRLILRSYIERSGMRAVCANDGADALMQYSALSPDLILLDVNMPKFSGFDVIQKIRERDKVPVIFISARSSDVDKLAGLGYGADDYVVKPFNPKEVIARILAVLRRTRTSKPAQLTRHDCLAVDHKCGKAQINRDDTFIDLVLTPGEFRLLAHMIKSPNQVFSRFELLEACFPDSEALERTVDSHVSNLRKKLAANGGDGFLTVMRGVGYRLGR